MREKIFNIIESNTDTKGSKIYDTIMIVVICVSIVPLIFKEQYLIFSVLDKVTVSVFIIDYVLRLVTADYKYKKHSIISFVRYPFSPMAIIDLLTILPSFAILHEGFKALRVLRLFRALKVVRVLRYSKNVRIILDVFEKERKPLLTVLWFAVGYVFISALIMYQVEPQTFDSFFDACYWATVSLTTMGYGDLYAVTEIGRLFTMLSAFVGIAIVALPAGIITAGYLEEVNARKQGDEKSKRKRARIRSRYSHNIKRKNR